MENPNTPNVIPHDFTNPPPLIAPPSFPLTFPLNWDDDTDEDGKHIVEAAGASSDGESWDLYYRLKAHTQNGVSGWIEASNPEMMSDEENPRFWATLGVAKAEIQAGHDEMMADYLAHPEPAGEE
tara:strand:- start:1186 stop:1560 length:375 start_codon:yes stop_codon:yes gene_type:complete